MIVQVKLNNKIKLHMYQDWFNNYGIEGRRYTLPMSNVKILKNSRDSYYIKQIRSKSDQLQYEKPLKRPHNF